MSDEPPGRPSPDPRARGSGPALAPGSAGAAPGSVGGSYADRYRGTEWGGPAPESEPDAPTARFVIDRRLVAGAGVLVAACVLVAIVAGALAGKPSLPAGVLLDLSHTPSPPTATPGLADDPAVVDRLFDRLALARRGYAVQATVTVTGAGRDATMRISGQVAGQDWQAEIVTTPAAGAGRDARVVHVGGISWLQRAPAAAWKRASVDIADVPDVDIFSGILVRGDLAYVGTALHDGAWLHHLAARSGWISDATRDLGSARGRQVNAARLDIWTTGDGTPTEAVYTAEIGLVATSVRGSYAISATYRFSNVGTRVKITSPR